MTAQPLVDESLGSILCWNGEAWKIDDQPVAGNDAQLVFNHIIQVFRFSSPNVSYLEAKNSTLLALANVLSAISGPFSFLFYDAAFGRIVYGRDALGRRSLLSKVVSADDWAIASIYDGFSPGKWKEVEADGIYSIDLKTRTTEASTNRAQGVDTTSTIFIPWVNPPTGSNPQIKLVRCGRISRP